jgi:hypothetical protein
VPTQIRFDTHVITTARKGGKGPMETGTKRPWFGGNARLTRGPSRRKLSLPKLLNSNPFQPIPAYSPGVPRPIETRPSCLSAHIEPVDTKRQSCPIVRDRATRQCTTSNAFFNLPRSMFSVPCREYRFCKKAMNNRRLFVSLSATKWGRGLGVRWCQGSGGTSFLKERSHSAFRHSLFRVPSSTFRVFTLW